MKRKEQCKGYLVAKHISSTIWCDRYEVSMRKSYREGGEVKKRETYLMTYYLPWCTKKSPHPQTEREYPEQWENISPTHMKYFEEDKTLMSRVIEIVKKSEAKRLEKMKSKEDLLNFWCDKIKEITDSFCEDTSRKMEFYYWVNKNGIAGRYKHYPKEAYEMIREELTNEISYLYGLFMKHEIMKEPW